MRSSNRTATSSGSPRYWRRASWVISPIGTGNLLRSLCSIARRQGIPGPASVRRTISLSNAFGGCSSMKSVRPPSQVMPPRLKGWSMRSVDAWTGVEVTRSVAIVGKRATG